MWGRRFLEFNGAFSGGFGEYLREEGLEAKSKLCMGEEDHVGRVGGGKMEVKEQFLSCPVV